MNWADDTAYSLNDLVDGIAAGFIRLENVERWAADQAAASNAEHIEKILKAIRERKTEAMFGRKIGSFINACRLEERTNFLSGTTNRFRYQLTVDPAIVREAALYKKLAADLLFRSPQLQQLEHKGDHILRKIFETFEAQYLCDSEPKMSLFSRRDEQRIRSEPTPKARARLICDHLAGMTDGFAVRTYKRLFDPDFGSIVDLT
jgi:dGTPase